MKEFTVIASFGGKQRTVKVVQPRLSGNEYQVLIDNSFQGTIAKSNGEWSAYWNDHSVLSTDDIPVIGELIDKNNHRLKPAHLTIQADLNRRLLLPLNDYNSPEWQREIMRRLSFTQLQVRDPSPRDSVPPTPSPLDELGRQMDRGLEDDLQKLPYKVKEFRTIASIGEEKHTVKVIQPHLRVEEYQVVVDGWYQGIIMKRNGQWSANWKSSSILGTDDIAIIGELIDENMA